MCSVNVRAYQPADRGAVRDISFRTGFMGESAAPFWGHAESWADVWTSYYTDREPESLSVGTIDGRVVGYLAGCVDTAAMRPTIDQLFATAIRNHRLLVRRGTAGFLLRGLVDGLRDRDGARGEFIDSRWPAHLHIDLLPEARGIGLGAGLMARWLERLRELGVPGCHLATLAENDRAVAFFERSGFRGHGPSVLVPGMRSPEGGRLHQLIMVREIGGTPARPRA
jgi:ribosomal protein S18 acetylase RimI-like enzyme